MTERPILFSGPMVRAILAGKKTQTRRVVKPQPPDWLAQHLDSGFRMVKHLHGDLYGAMTTVGGASACRSEDTVRCPYGKPGDTLWVRETFAGEKSRPLYLGHRFYRADGDVPGVQGSLSYFERESRWRPAIHMPREFSRISLRVTAVRVERLQEISEEDAIAEGIPRIPDSELVCHCGTDIEGHGWGDNHSFTPMPEHRYELSKFWDEINGKRAPWASNPWVWVVTFERINEESK